MHLSSEICELNPIEMVRHPHFYLRWISNSILVFGGGVNIVIEKYQKSAALECLNACPVDVIRRFGNRSWRFMDAYRKGLTAKAAVWAVKQRGHQSMLNSHAVRGHR